MKLELEYEPNKEANFSFIKLQPFLSIKIYIDRCMMRIKLNFLLYSLLYMEIKWIIESHVPFEHFFFFFFFIFVQKKVELKWCYTTLGLSYMLFFLKKLSWKSIVTFSFSTIVLLSNLNWSMVINFFVFELVEDDQILAAFGHSDQFFG